LIFPVPLIIIIAIIGTHAILNASIAN